MVALTNLASMIGTFMVLFGGLYFVQRYTIGLFPFFKRQLRNGISLGDVLFCLTSLAFIIGYIDILPPS